MTPTVLIIDDDSDYAHDLAAVLSPEFSCRFALSGEEGLGAIAAELPDAVLLDLKLGARGGLEILTEIRSIDPTLPVIMATDHPSSETEAEALRRGALYYVRKAAGRAEVICKLQKSTEISQTRRERDRLQAGVGRTPGTFLFTSRAMRKLEVLVDRIAAARHATVLITGETGTGKSHLAREVHRRSPLAEKPFLQVNVATLDGDTVRSELFGHTKGAFTGAATDRKGHFETVGQGTVFLDEIGDLSLSVQGHLLQAIEERQILPVGSSSPRSVDARVMAATNRDLRGMVERGEFRNDLFGRLSALTLHVPPLREHPEDVTDLANYFLGRHACELGMQGVSITSEAMARLQEHSWRDGNARELQWAMLRALVMSAGASALGPGDFELAPEGARPATFDYNQEKDHALRGFQRQFFRRAFTAIGSSVDNPRPEDTQKIADLAGVPPQTVRRVLRELGTSHATDPGAEPQGRRA
jgi:DNA-binding NtrC family response regulator